jgi:hypothetical protein
MSSDIDFLDLQLQVHRATQEQQRSLLLWLVSKVVADQGGGPRTIDGERGDPIGVFIPNTHYRNQPPMSSEQYADLLEAIRNTSPDQLLTHEEVLRQLGLEDVQKPFSRTTYEIQCPG